MQNILRVNPCQCVVLAANRTTERTPRLFRALEKCRAGFVGFFKRNALRAEAHFDSPQVYAWAFMGLGA